MKNLAEKNKSRGNTAQISKFWRILLFAIIFSGIPFIANSQVKSVTIQVKDATVESVIKSLQVKTETDFLFNHEEVNKCAKVSVSVTNGTIDEVLRQTLKDTHLTFKKINNAYVITPKKEEPKEKAEALPGLKQSIRGTVIDRDSKITLPGANVVVTSVVPVIGTVADMDGNFILENVPVGRQSLKVSYIGFEDAVISEILVGSSKEVVLTIELNESLMSLNEVKITASKNEALNEMASVSAQSFSVEETQRYAASISDPARMAQSFAGVAGGDDASNEIIIRGNSPAWMLWRLEGIEIPNPNHFAEEGSTTGAISILSSNLVSKSDFYTGAFPAEFGSALSGVFDIRLRKGNNQKREYAFQAGLLGLDFAAEGPFKKGYEGSYLFNYRYSTLSLLNLMGVKITGTGLPNYQDLSYKLHLPTEKIGSFSIWGIGGLSDEKEVYSPDTSLGEQFKYGYDEFTKTGMYATGITHNYFPDQKSYIKTTLAQTGNMSAYTQKLMDTTGTFYDNFIDDLNKKAIRASTMYNRKLSNRVTARIGGTYSHLSYDYASDARNEMNEWEKYLDNSGSTYLIQSYIQSKVKLSENISATTGIHYSHFALSNDNSVEPRLGLTWRLPNDQKVGVGAGMHSKHENLTVYLTEVQRADGTYHTPNKNLKMTRSTHFVASYEKRIRTNLNLKLEAYYQSISKLPVPNNPDKYWAPIFGGTSNNDTLANIGEGRNYGIELTLQKYFADDYYFLLTSSIFDSKYKPASGKWMNTKFNAQYVSNFVVGKEFKWGENRIVSLNSKLIWNGGKRIIPIDLEASKAAGHQIVNIDQIYSESAKDYFRLDLGVRVHFFRPTVQHTISLDIQNATNRTNVWAKIYDPQAEEIIDYPMAGIIPVLNYKVEF